MNAHKYSDLLATITPSKEIDNSDKPYPSKITSGFFRTDQEWWDSDDYKSIVSKTKDGNALNNWRKWQESTNNGWKKVKK